MCEYVCILVMCLQCPLDVIPEDGLTGWTYQTMLTDATLHVSVSDAVLILTAIIDHK